MQKTHVTLLHTHLQSWEDTYELFLTHAAALESLRVFVTTIDDYPRVDEMTEPELIEVCTDHGHGITIVELSPTA